MKDNLIIYKYLAPLIVVFLFSNAKAELCCSAFVTLSNLEKSSVKKSLLFNDNKKDLEKAKKLFEQGNHTESFKLALPLLESESLEIRIQANLLIGKIHEKNINNKEALFYLRNSLKLLDKDYNSIETGNNPDMQIAEAESLTYLSRIYVKIYRENQKVDSCFYYLNRLINIETFDSKISVLKARAYNNLSILEYDEKKYLEAKEYINKSIDIFERLKERKELSIAYMNLASIYDVTNQKEKALEIYLKALPLVEKDKDQQSMQYKENLYFNIAWTLYNLKDHTAYEYLEKSYYLKDTLVDMNLRAELKKIDQLHNIDLVKQEEESKRQQLQNNMWILVALVALALSTSLYFATLSKLKQKDLKLQLSENKLAQQRKIDNLRIESQEKIINASLDAKEKERQQIAEVLHDNVSAMLSSANMHLLASKKVLNGDVPPEIEKTQRIIKEASQKIRDLSHDLMSSILLKFGLEYAVKDIAKKYSNSELKIFTEIEDVERYSQNFEIKVFNIIQELLNNILKHSKASFAYITIEERDNRLYFIVKDNGVGGLEEEDLETDGVGLSQIKARVKIMMGDIYIDSEKNKGTEVMIVLPIIPREKLTAST